MIKLNEMKLQDKLRDVESFEKMMGKPQASYTPSKEELYEIGLNKLRKKENKIKSKMKSESIDNTTTDYATKQGILDIIKKKYKTNLDYTAISNVYQIAISHKIDITLYPDDIMTMYEAELIIKPEAIELITKIEEEESNYNITVTESELNLLLNYKHEMNSNQKNQFFGLLRESSQRVKDEVIKTMIPMQKTPDIIIRMMKSNLLNIEKTTTQNT